MHDEIITMFNKIIRLRGRAVDLMYTELLVALKAAKTLPKLAPYE